MNIYLMLTTAALFGAHVTVAEAGVHSFGLATSAGGDYCDYGTAYTGVDGGAYGGNVWAWQHTNVDCTGTDSYGQGLAGKNPITGKSVDMSDSFLGNSSFTLNYVLPSKLKNGKPWSLWCQISGTTSFKCNGGILIDVDAPHHPKGKISTLSVVAEFIRAHKQARPSPH
ncbi:MAG: hypothetical protein ACJ8IR_06465 [Alphaproteobacteria bacterium]|jgi:hypothetical protein